MRTAGSRVEVMVLPATWRSGGPSFVTAAVGADCATAVAARRTRARVSKTGLRGMAIEIIDEIAQKKWRSFCMRLKRMELPEGLSRQTATTVLPTEPDGYPFARSRWFVAWPGSDVGERTT